MESCPIYLSVGVNQTKKCLDWNHDLNLIAYAASNRVILYDPLTFYVVGISKENHGSLITCIRWINGNSDKYLITTSTDGSAKIWVYKPFSFSNFISPSPKEFALINGHNGSVSCGYGVSLPNSENRNEECLFIVTTGEDFCIKGWSINVVNGCVEELFTYKLPGRALVLDITIISSKNNQHWPLVAYGGDDGNTYIMSSEDGKKYNINFKLSGHHDWITSLAYCIDDDDILLSTGSKDGLIRLWKISPTIKEILPEDEFQLHTKSLEISVPKMSVKCGENNNIYLYCTLESVMQGHEGLLAQLDWISFENRTLLLSCTKTEDRSIIVWEPEEDPSAVNGEKIWVEKTRLGEVGGNREGFFNCKFSPKGDKIAAVSYQGGLHLWHYENNSWVPQPVVSGHFDEVVDISWDRMGRYLLSVSKDRTTRLHCSLKDTQEKWQEIARPQVHGLDMSCVSSLNPVTFVSGSEEKLLRGFTATKTFLRRFHTLCSFDSLADIDNLELPEKASIPSLGLSNKADEGDLEGDNDSIPRSGDEVSDHFNTNINDILPTENELMLGTVWSEVSKLYGHGNEILAVASSPDGTLIASSCKATAPEDAKVIIWDTKEWKELQSLPHHRLTVTQMEFSSCGQYLLTVSRDRTWAVFQKTSNDDFTLKFHSGNLSKEINHSRIIWSCCWVPDSLSFITGSRDKTVALWSPIFDADGKAVSSWERVILFHEEEEVVAVAVDKVSCEENKLFIIAAGCVDGSINLKLFNIIENEIVKETKLEISHRKSVRRLRFRPHGLTNAAPTKAHKSDSIKQNPLMLSSCGNDNLVILYNISV